jgi:hypothetical protein
MADANQIKQWLDQNADKAGTPNFVIMSDEYNKLTQASQAPDPYSVGNTARRVIGGAITGIPDTVIGIGNALVRAGGSGGGLGMAGVEPGSVKEAPYVGPMLNKATGGQELPPEASTARQLLEGGGSALLGGGANLVRSAVSAAPTAAAAVMPAARALLTGTVAPTVGSHYGGQAGGYVGEKLGDRETGTLLGSLFGGAAGAGASSAPTRYTDWRFRGQGSENAPAVAAAAERQGVTPSAGMLGNERIQSRERMLANRFGGSDFTVGRRNEARDQIGAALDRMTEARGSTDAAPTPGSIGYDVTDVARVGRDQLAERSSTGQQELMDRVGPRTDVDIAGVLAEMERVRGRTDPGTAQPIDARLNTLRQMLPGYEDGQVTSHTVPYERLKDWRTSLRQRSQNYDPVPGRFAGDIYRATTDAMRNAAEGAGVPGEFFDTTQARTAGIMGPGGPHEQLSTVAGSEPSSAYSYLKGGEQNPGRLRELQATGSPALDRIFGDYLRLMGNDTINNPNQGSRGPAQFATRIEKMDPQALDVIGGAQRPDVMDIATLARSFDYPTSQTGLGRTMGPIGQGIPGSLTAGEIGGSIAHSIGLPASIGRGLGYLTGPARNFLEARQLQSPAARNALAGGPAPASPSISDLVAAINAAQATQQQQRR